MRRKNLPRAGGFQDACCPNETTPKMRAIEIRKRVVGNGMALLIDRDTAAVAIAQKYADGRDVRKLREQGTVLRRITPRKHGNADDRLKRRSFILHPEIPSEEAVFVRVDRLHRPFPRANLFFEHAAYVRNGMEVEMPANVFVAEAGTKEQRRCVQGAASADDCFAANAYTVALSRTRFYPGCGTGLDSNAHRACLNDKSSAMLLRICKPRFCRRLLGAESATVATVTTNFSLVAAGNITGHRVDVPSQCAQAAIQNLLAVRDAIVLAIDLQSFAHRVKAPRVFVAREPRHSRRGPFRSNVVGRSKRSAVVDDCRSAQAFTGKQADAVIGGGGETCFAVQPLETTKLRAVEIVDIVITASIENDHIFPRRGENRGGSTAAGAGTSDANFAGQIHLAIRHDYLEWAGRRSLWRAKRARIFEVFPDFAAAAVFRRQHDVEKPDRLSKGLKCGPALADAAVSPGKQNANAVLLRETGKRL